jgi:hypothetical protein
MKNLFRTVVAATAVAGTLDIAMAFLTSERSPSQVLRSVASGPFGGAMSDGGSTAALLGLLVHFTIMAVMVVVFVVVSRRWPGLLARAWLSGAIYGLLLYLVMYWIVLPWRWPSVFPVAEPVEVAMALFAHVVLVGIPIALITVKMGSPSRS